MTDAIGVIIVAAGAGSRFRHVAGPDKDKLLADCTGRDGVLRAVIEQVLASLPVTLKKRVLVTRPDRPQVVRMAQAYGCDVLELESPGLGDSIAAGVRRCPDLGGWLILLGDMPFLLSSSVEAVAAAVREEGISVPVHAGHYGHPVGFGRTFGPRLMALKGDQGAKALFAEASVTEVAVDDPGVVWDVDVPQALNFR